MYSLSWFETFATHQPSEQLSAELSAIARLAPADHFPRLLDIGCGNGRVAHGLAEHGYRVTGIDINDDALAQAAARIPNGQFVRLDQRQIPTLEGPFDVALILWNSMGFGTRTEDADILHAVAQILRPGGLLLMDLYHPDWLKSNEQVRTRDVRGAIIDRTVRDDRCFHRIEYDTGTVDHIEFNVYSPDAITELLLAAGFAVDPPLVWWRSGLTANAAHARYQLRCSR